MKCRILVYSNDGRVLASGVLQIFQLCWKNAGGAGSWVRNNVRKYGTLSGVARTGVEVGMMERSARGVKGKKGLRGPS